jgi:SAM-dependent methyltransferase
VRAVPGTAFDPSARFPDGFFDRADESPDAAFYAFDRFVTHLDAGAIAAVGALYRDLGLDGDVLDICSSWISHFDPAPARLVVVGMNERELAANPAATDRHVVDLNLRPTLPFDARTFDAVTCCVSVDYLTRPIEVFAEVARVLRPGGVFVCTFSNRCFPTKAIRGWLHTDDRGHVAIVEAYFELATEWLRAHGAGIDYDTPVAEHRNPTSPGDPLYAVWARTSIGV